MSARRNTFRFRRGSAYVVMLGLSLVVTVIGLGAILAVRVQARAADTMADAAEARFYAQSAIETGRVWIAQDPSWRTNHSNGQWGSAISIGTGSFTLDGTNPNGALNHADTDPVVLTGTGVKGRARQKAQVTMTAVVSKLTCLDAAITSVGTITFSAATVQATNQTVCSNNTITAASSTINANVEACTQPTGSTYNPTTTHGGVTARTVPDASVFDYYKNNGTSIAITSLPLSGSNRIINLKVMSPTLNPFPTPTGGPGNAQGIYVIDCLGTSVLISNSRIIGTIVLLNAGPATAVSSMTNWQPAVSNYPCLLVQGNCAIKTTAGNLAESTVNFNPVGAPYPYPGGTTNATISAGETYPSIFKGLVYVSGTAALTLSPTMSLLVVGSTTSAIGTITMTYDSTYATSPPPGFATTSMKVSPGTYTQAVDP